MTDTPKEYPNPLDNFRTYSYHYVMTAGSTTECFRALLGDGGNEKRPRLLSLIDDVGLGGKIKAGENTAYLVMDTRRFSQYSITSLEMEHSYGTGSRVNPTVPMAATSIKIKDTTGLSFFNFLMDLMRNKLQSTRASAFFLLTIIFVGHKDDGTTETIATCNIPMILLTMQFEFTSSGSEYDIQFMEVEGAPPRGAAMQHINYLGKVGTISTQGGPNTLDTALQALENRLNIQSLEFYQKYFNDALKKNPTASEKGLQLGKLVQYMITLPDEWKNFKIVGATRSENVEERFQGFSNTGEKTSGTTTTQVGSDANRYSQFTFSHTTTITDAIKVILESSKDFLDLASKQRRVDGSAKGVRCLTTITSDDATYTIHFDLYEYDIPKADAKTDSMQAGNGQRQVVGQTPIKNLLTYDYIFTGRNSHIRDLKIQYTQGSEAALDADVDIGRNRFARVAAQGQDAKKNAEAAKGVAETRDLSPQLRPGDPVFLPIVTKAQQNNNTGQKNEELKGPEAVELFKANQEYTQTYAFLHFMSSINTEMTIRGNPELLRKFADRDMRGGIPPHSPIISVSELNSLVSQSQQSAQDNFDRRLKLGISDSKRYYIENYTKKRAEAAKKSTNVSSIDNKVDVATSPMFVKVNIRAPNVDYTGNRKQDALGNLEPLFTDKFFFDGVYMMLVMRTTLIDGEFEQHLSLIPYDLPGTYSQSQDQPVVGRPRGGQ